MAPPVKRQVQIVISVSVKLDGRALIVTKVSVLVTLSLSSKLTQVYQEAGRVITKRESVNLNADRQGAK